MLCSNSWQSAGGSAVSQHSSGNHVANEPSSLHPPAVNIRRLPEFDQDSWTINAPPGTEKTRGTALDLHNNNNSNNNNTLTPVQATGWHSAARQASDLDRRPADSTPPLRTAEGAGAGAAATSGARTQTPAAAPPSERSGTSNEAVASDNMMVVTLTPNGLDELQPINEAREPAAINGEGVQESSTSGEDVVP